MIVHVTRREGEIILAIRATGPGVKGDLFVSLKPGQSGLGKTYDEWMAVESPTVEID